MKDGVGERTDHQLSPTESLAAAKMLTDGDVSPCLGGAESQTSPGSSDDRALLL